jgi:vesicle-fusing ATPase
VVQLEDLPEGMLYQECRDIIQELEGQTRAVLSEQIESLERIAAALLEEETINRTRFKTLMASLKDKHL